MMALDSQDVAEYARSHTKGLRLTFWLFKTDQVTPCLTLSHHAGQLKPNQLSLLSCELLESKAM